VSKSTSGSQIPERVLLGPGPSTVDQRVLRAMSRPLVGHLDPEFLQLMDATQEMLRQVMGTDNRMTFAISGTGSAGMEASIVNLVEPGDRVVVVVCGVFGVRLAEQARRNGAEVVTVEGEWGTPVEPTVVADAIAAGDTKVVAVVHAETSTGVLQPLDEIIAATHAQDALVVVDAVTSLGGHPVHLDDWGVDVCYSGTQKCLSCPPGLAPVSFNDRALERVKNRRTPVRSWYLDVGLLDGYWGQDRAYHHTAPISMAYALHEALSMVCEEGLEARHERHRRHHLGLVAGLEAMGMRMQVENPEHRLWSLNAVRVPEGVDEAAVRGELLMRFGIEIGGGLGPLAGQIWRIGLMGASSTENNVLLVLAALEAALHRQGCATSPGAGVAAAIAALATD